MIITQSGVLLHAARSPDRYFLPWDVAYTKAASLRAGADTDPRKGNLRRQIGGAS